jgi:hypothetical protein
MLSSKDRGFCFDINVEVSNHLQHAHQNHNHGLFVLPSVLVILVNHVLLLGLVQGMILELYHCM